MAVARLEAEKLRRIVLRLHRDEAVVTAETPPAAIPLDAPADVAGEKRLRFIDAKTRRLERFRPPTPPVTYGTTVPRIGADTTTFPV